MAGKAGMRGSLGIGRGKSAAEKRLEGNRDHRRKAADPVPHPTTTKMPPPPKGLSAAEADVWKGLKDYAHVPVDMIVRYCRASALEQSLAHDLGTPRGRREWRLVAEMARKCQVELMRVPLPVPPKAEMSPMEQLMAEIEQNEMLGYNAMGGLAGWPMADTSPKRSNGGGNGSAVG